jgi:hypothetical protein
MTKHSARNPTHRAPSVSVRPAPGVVSESLALAGKPLASHVQARVGTLATAQARKAAPSIQQPGPPPPAWRPAQRANPPSSLGATVQARSVAGSASHPGPHAHPLNAARSVQRPLTGAIQRMQSVSLTNNNRPMIAYWLYQLGEGVVTAFQQLKSQEINALVELIVDEEDKGNDGVAMYKGEIENMLSALTKYIFSSNGILADAWSSAVKKTRSSRYSDVGSKFGYELRRMLDQIGMVDPDQNELIIKIKTDFINKHHVLLKSKFPDLQIKSFNLLHAGHGSQGSTNTDLHKSMHKMTSVSNSTNYSRMHQGVTDLLKAWVEELKLHTATLDI